MTTADKPVIQFDLWNDSFDAFWLADADVASTPAPGITLLKTADGKLGGVKIKGVTKAIRTTYRAYLKYIRALKREEEL